MNYLKLFAVIISIMMCLGGAVNSGWSSFYLAIPFMVVLIFVSYRHSKKFLLITILFIALCITVSSTQDKNPILYPVIKDGKITILRDGVHKSYSDGSGGFYDYDTIFINSLSEQQKKDIENLKQAPSLTKVRGSDASSNFVLTKVSKGDSYKVIGIHHVQTDFGDDIGITTDIGRFSPSDFSHSNKGHSLEMNKVVQAPWSKILGNLMYWPISPVVTLTAFKK